MKQNIFDNPLKIFMASGLGLVEVMPFLAPPVKIKYDVGLDKTDNELFESDMNLIGRDFYHSLDVVKNELPSKPEVKIIK